MNKINVVTWLEKYFDKKLIDERSLEPILHFSLLWNLFEHIFSVYPQMINSRMLESLSQKTHNSINITILDDTFNYFKKRYIDKNDKNSIFKKLLINKDD